ncbi:hypothetical protein G6F70_001706 [Rhizopus microsporus]|uniref:ubiquitinyl hydrolase 1 n=2 Tax=Rhizopus TaxID=4842 RepID=A0A1X0SGS4_RHIZD|nr:hypothetical protein G6F71_001732 [Rhizopus microsporus]KAG1203088.1 hypothetical protein G6F70_001706 [Rhizopus microsporus]KAG1215388.1 hypothetical protein G6F69_001063 [Rhizopus microsporus]KAG1237223.1 hypothetical protein G6F67_001385 [Rhizopus microsporus]KAG1268732.1 hypothetical protein G6F68_000861 [Rhizopus microsporus]
MPSGKNTDAIFMPSFCFGEITRAEINSVLSIAGVPLTPPKKTPFVTGIPPRKKPSEEKKIEPIKEEESVKKPPITNGTNSPVETPKPKPKSTATSWAALLKTSENKLKASSASSSTSTTASTSVPNNAPTVNGKQTPKTSTSPTPPITPKFTGIADIISKYEPTFNAPLLQPRGLINNVNTCFMNVILQPLSHCPPFYNLIKTISTQVAHNIKSKTPLLDSIIEFVNEFQTDRLDNTLEPYGEPFVPEYVYNALRGQKKFDTLRGRQEDSEEFLCFLLDGLHEEMTNVLKERQEKKMEEEVVGKGEGWLEVGAKNKTSNLRATGFEESPISKIFGGKVRSVLRCPGAKDSINLEPFQSLPLDIQPENVHSVEDAIANMTLPEIMHDYTSPKGIKVEATKQVYFERLPAVLILHMKRFVFDNVGGVQKLSKRVTYGSKLVINPEWMVPVLRPNESVTYKLFGIVYHHGSSAGGGHYTCDIKRRNGEWLHIDDTTITPVSEKDVLVTEENTRTSERIHAGQTAYILFYIKA